MTEAPSALDRATTDASATARPGRLNPRAVITGVLFVAIIGLAIWCLARPEPLLVQGEAESTRIDIALRRWRRSRSGSVRSGLAERCILMRSRPC